MRQRRGAPPMCESPIARSPISTADSPAQPQASPLAESLKSDPLAADFLVTAFAAAALSAENSNTTLDRPGWPPGFSASEARNTLAVCPKLPSVLTWYYEQCGTPQAAAQTGVPVSISAGERFSSVKPLLRSVLCNKRVELTTAARTEVDVALAVSGGLPVQPSLAFRIKNAEDLRPLKSSATALAFGFAPLPFGQVYAAIHRGHVPVRLVYRHLHEALHVAVDGCVGPEWAGKSGLLGVLQMDTTIQRTTQKAVVGHASQQSEGKLCCILVCEFPSASLAEESTTREMAYCRYALVWPALRTEIESAAQQNSSLPVGLFILTLLLIAVAICCSITFLRLRS